MKTIAVTLLAATLGLSGAALAAKDDNKGHGAGGARAEHASEQGLDKGKAWAGTREREEKMDDQADNMDRADKPKKAKKAKKAED